MAITEAQKNAVRKYNDAHYKRVALSMKIEQAEALYEYCAATGQSINGFINGAIMDALESKKVYSGKK